MFDHPASSTRYPASRNITTYTAGPQKSMNFRIDSIPRQNTIACAIHMIPNPIQPSNDNPANPYCAVSAYGANPGHNLIARSTRATEPDTSGCRTRPPRSTPG